MGAVEAIQVFGFVDFPFTFTTTAMVDICVSYEYFMGHGVVCCILCYMRGSRAFFIILGQDAIDHHPTRLLDLFS